jgi:hypothetical protein
VPEVSSEDSSSKSKNAITREKPRSVELGRKEFPTWRAQNLIFRLDANCFELCHLLSGRASSWGGTNLV